MEKKRSSIVDCCQDFIGNGCGRVIDLTVKSSSCLKCTINQTDKTEDEFEDWYDENHEKECTRNHGRTSGGMEAVSVIKMFKRSEKKYGFLVETETPHWRRRLFNVLKRFSRKSL